MAILRYLTLNHFILQQMPGYTFSPFGKDYYKYKGRYMNSADTTGRPYADLLDPDVCRHLIDMAMPDLSLPSTDGTGFDFGPAPAG
jgi:hypothetical protein|tara:strand:- start:278 stop:535 length:258 start_codon:yes stop_codon:yes gene_type:complete